MRLPGKVESVKSRTVDPADIFNSLEDSRKSKEPAEKITSAEVYFEASRRRLDLLDKVNTDTGERQAE